LLAVQWEAADSLAPGIASDAKALNIVRELDALFAHLRLHKRNAVLRALPPGDRTRARHDQLDDWLLIHRRRGTG
jgi:hypothetical protein